MARSESVRFVVFGFAIGPAERGAKYAESRWGEIWSAGWNGITRTWESARFDRGGSWSCSILPGLLPSLVLPPPPFRPLFASRTEELSPQCGIVFLSAELSELYKPVGRWPASTVPFVTASLWTLCETTLPAILSRIDEHDDDIATKRRSRMEKTRNFRLFYFAPRTDETVEVFDHAFVSPKISNAAFVIVIVSVQFFFFFSFSFTTQSNLIDSRIRRITEGRSK